MIIYKYDYFKNNNVIGMIKLLYLLNVGVYIYIYIYIYI